MNFADFMDSTFGSRASRQTQALRDIQFQDELSKKDALQKLFGGFDPSTGVTWNSGRNVSGVEKELLPMQGPLPQALKGAPMMNGQQANAPDLSSAPVIDPGEQVGAKQRPMLLGAPQLNPQRAADFQQEQRQTAARAFPQAMAASAAAKLFPAPMSKDDYLGGSFGVFNTRKGALEPGTAPVKPPMKTDLIKLKLPSGEIRDFDATTQQDDILGAVKAGAQEIKMPSTSVNITNSGDKAVTGVDAKRYENTTKTLDRLDMMSPLLDRMMSAIDNGAQTGFGQNWYLPIKQGIEELTGTPIAGTSEQEVFKSLQNYLGPNMRTPGSGSSSDTDVKMFVDSIPTLVKSEGGNKALAQFYGKIRSYTASVAQIQQDLLRKYEYIPVGEERKQIEALGPIFTPEERQILKGSKKQDAPAQPNSQRPPEAKQAPDGKYYSPDPNRPGKYLMWP